MAIDDLLSSKAGNVDLLGLGWERAKSDRILQTFAREYFRVHYVTCGQGTLKALRQTYTLSEGTGFFIYPGETPQYSPDQENPWEYFWLAIKSDLIEDALLQLGITRTAPCFKVTDSREQMCRIMADMCSAPIRETPIQAYFTTCLLDFFHRITPFDAIKRNKSYYLEQCLTIIHQKYDSDISICSIADELAIDRTYLYKLFKADIGTSPQAYLINHRLSKARDLLQATELSVGHIALDVGFCDLSDFSKQFKHRYGISPSRFRNQ